MTALDNIKAALEAGPQVLITDGYYAACNPSAIRELLAYVESLEKDAARYRVIRNREHGFILERDRPGWRDTIPWLQGTDAAIDAAMEQTK